jgi:SNF2 family DNA or RNA helicase
LERPDIQTILIICPLVIKAQWVEAITTLVKEAGSPIVMVDDLLSRTPIIEEFRNVEEQNGSAPFRVWVIAHYEQFINKSSARPVFDRGWHLVIVDEIHKIAGRTAQRTQNICKLRSNYRWGLSGTPMRDRPKDLWQPLNWVDPEHWSSYWAFVRRFTHTQPGKWGGMDIEGTRNLDQLDRETRPYLLIRKREDVGQELPPLTVTPIHLTPTEAQEKLYARVSKEVMVALSEETRELREEGVWDFTAKPPDQLIIKNAISRFTRLHQCASAPGQFIEKTEGAKEEWLRNYVTGGGEPAVILTRYNASVRAIKRILKELGVEKEYLVGTWDKLSTGLNLQHYCILIAWDCTFKRLDREQGIGRIERTGQLRPMTVFDLILGDSVDLDVKEMIDSKQTEVDMVLEWLKRSFVQ